MSRIPLTGTLTAAILTAASLCSTAQAQGNGEGSWDNLRLVRPGQSIEVVDMKLHAVQGDFAAFSGEAISLRSDEGDVTTARGDVLSVKNRQRSRRGRHVLMGLGIGAAAGLAVGAASYANYCSGPHEDGEAGLFLGLPTLIGAGAGAGIGAAAPSGRATIYRVKRRN